MTDSTLVLAFGAALLAGGAACLPAPDLLAGEPTETAAPITSLSGALAGTTDPSSDVALIDGGQGGLQWATPGGWSELPPANSMRIAQWSIPGATDGQEAECALFSFPGGGSTEANIGRWIGQFEQPDGASSAERAERMQMRVREVPVTLIQVTGTFLAPDQTMRGPVDPRPDHALFAAIFETTPDPHFLKCTGPRETIGDRALELSTFVMSFDFGA